MASSESIERLDERIRSSRLECSCGVHQDQTGRNSPLRWRICPHEWSDRHDRRAERQLDSSWSRSTIDCAERRKFFRHGITAFWKTEVKKRWSKVKESEYSSKTRGCKRQIRTRQGRKREIWRLQGEGQRVYWQAIAIRRRIERTQRQCHRLTPWPLRSKWKCSLRNCTYSGRELGKRHGSTLTHGQLTFCNNRRPDRITILSQIPFHIAFDVWKRVKYWWISTGRCVLDISFAIDTCDGLIRQYGIDTLVPLSFALDFDFLHALLPPGGSGRRLGAARCGESRQHNILFGSLLPSYVFERSLGTAGCAWGLKEHGRRHLNRCTTASQRADPNCWFGHHGRKCRGPRRRDSRSQKQNR